MNHAPPAALRALMEGIIDYAGLFPPAKLPLDEALRNYAADRRRPEAWMQARFICPAKQLAQVREFEQFGSENRPWQFSILGSGEADADSSLSALNDDLAAIHTFIARSGGRAVADAFEVRVPAPLLRSGSANDLREWVRRASEMLDRKAPGEIAPYFEIVFFDPWRETVGTAIAAVAEHNRSWSGQRCRYAGAKIRTGGVEAAAFPAVEQVAFWISRCAAEGVPFKATAGLHHPIRRYAAEVQTKMHGFLNVFLAAALAVRPGGASFDEAQLKEILNDESPSAFAFTADGASWRGHAVSTAEIHKSRRRFARSYGSCSFLEPIEDLKTLDLL